VARTDDLFELPPDLPVPVDDGACDHLPGMAVPPVSLRSTAGRWVRLSELPGRTVVYCYPRTGEPDRDPPAGWNEIPGARGCTPQTCAFRDHHAEIRALGAEVFGLSTQTTRYQREMVERLRVPFEVLSDVDLLMARALRLPTLTVQGMVLVKRLTMIVSDGVIEHVMYPVFPPDRNAEDVVGWLRARSAR
jgi:peroxiredoxin